MKNTLRSIVVLGSVMLVLAGCVSPQLSETRTGTLVYGSFTYEDGRLSVVAYRDRAMVVGFSSQMRTLDEGAFYRENMQPGEYLIGNVNFVTGLGGRADFSFGLGATPPRFVVGDAPLVYVGAYRFGSIEEGFLLDEAQMTPDRSVTETDVLEAILPHAEGTEWEGLIRDRIRELDGR